MFRLRIAKPLINRVVRSAHTLSAPVVRSNYGKLFLGTAVSSAIALSIIMNQSEAAGLFDWGCSVDIAKVKKDINDLIDADDEKRGDGTSIAATLVRLAWHASGTYSAADKSGGSNGSTMRYAPEAEWGANAGLKLTRDFLEPIKKKYPSMSYADIWTLAGATAIEHMGGPQIPWRQGRSDSPKPTAVPDGRLPDAAQGSKHIHDVFGRMGLTDGETVALIGAHAVGRCHPDRSGFWGPWTRAETTFSNEYFRLLLEEKWSKKTMHEGKPWKGPMQYESPDKALMMLPADLALLQDPNYKKYVVMYAKDEALFFKDFASAFGKLLELGVEFK